MRKDTLRLCLLAPEGELTFPTIPHTVAALHDQVRGYFETFPLPTLLMRRGFVGLCNEDGQRLGEKVTAAPNPERRLVCVPCLTRDSPPYEPVVVHGDPHHCGDCWVAARERGWFPAEARSPRWWGT